jgi:hypothetical protein
LLAGISSLSRQTYVLDFLKPALGTRALPPLLLEIADDDSNDPPTIQNEVLPA